MIVPLLTPKAIPLLELSVKSAVDCKALQSTADFTLNSNRGIALGVSNGTINVDGSTILTYGGIIAGSGSFTKIGSGMLVLTSQLSTYSGGTINNAGTLKLAATSIGSYQWKLLPTLMYQHY